jgi:hypothetical protein
MRVRPSGCCSSARAISQQSLRTSRQPPPAPGSAPRAAAWSPVGSGGQRGVCCAAVAPVGRRRGSTLEHAVLCCAAVGGGETDVQSGQSSIALTRSHIAHLHAQDVGACCCVVGAAAAAAAHLICINGGLTTPLLHLPQTTQHSEAPPGRHKHTWARRLQPRLERRSPGCHQPAQAVHVPGGQLEGGHGCWVEGRQHYHCCCAAT